MKSYHLLIVSAFVFLAFVIFLVQSISPSSSVVAVQCNPERLNQVHDFNLFGWGKNLSGAFLVPSEYSYAKFYGIINASLLGSCSSLNSNCDYYINGVLCGSIPTNMTSAGNSSGGKQVYSISCLSSIKSGTNVLISSGSIDKVFVEMDIVPANC